MILACLIIGALVIGVAWATHITEADGHSAPCWDLFGVGRVISIIRAVRNGSILYYMDQFWPMYGDTYTLNIMGTKVTFTRDATNIKQVLATNWQDYNAAKGIRDALWEHLAPRTVAAVDGTEWEDARKKWRHSLVHIDQLFDIPFFEASFQKLVHRIPRQAVDVQSLFLDLGTDIVSNLVVGKSLDCIGPENQSPENRRYVEALSRANPVTAMRGFLGPLARINPEFGYKADCDIITGHVAHLVRERLSTIQERKLDGLEAVSTQQTFLERLLIHSKDTSMVNGDLVSLMMGNEEMARPLSHTIFQRSRHPEVYQKLRESIIGLVGYEPPAYEQLNMFAYLKDVLNEGKNQLSRSSISKLTAYSVKVTPTCSSYVEEGKHRHLASQRRR